MIRTFINRPILSSVVSIIIVILGILGLLNLPVTQYPEIAPPTVMIRANYTGANAETVLKSVIIPIEEQINGVEGMTYIQSSASNNGSASIEVFFRQGTDPDIAAVNVQNRVARAAPILPQEVNQSGVVTQKQQRGALMFLSFYTENPELTDVFLQNYVAINVIPEIQRINGVGEANVFGGRTYSMRVWLDPQKLAAYSLVPADVISAINEQSREAAAGSVGQNSGNSFEYVIKYPGKYDEETEYGDIVVKSLGQGQFLRLKDVATIELDALSYTGVGENLGHPAVSMGIFQTPGSNAQQIIDDIKSYLENAQPSFPEGIDYTINFDSNEFLEASINKVVITLLEAFVLVFLVVFIFLQDFRSTLIPAIAVPVSIIGAFFFLNLLGYSINLLTLFALVLAIGIVVDDAIVVVEAVHAKLDQGETNVKKATVEAMHEITVAIISITLVMAAVFVPVTFISGPTGMFYKQFGVTLIVAILISAVNALTLSPALSALFLKGHEGPKHQEKGWLNAIFRKFNTAFREGTDRYGRAFIFLIRNKWVTLVVLLISGGLIFLAASQMRTGFVPTEDRGVIFASFELPPGASMERTYNVIKAMEKEILEVPGVRGMTISTGRSLMGGSGSNFGMGFVRLESFDERKGKDGQDALEIIPRLFAIGAKYPDSKTVFFGPPSVPGFGSSAGFEFVLLDRSGGNLIDLNNTAAELINNLAQRPEIEYAQTAFNTNYPQLQMDINVERAKESGVSVNSILSTMQGLIGGLYAADFSKYGKQYRVMVQSLPESRTDETALSNMYVRTASGQMAPVSQFVTLHKTTGPQSVSRFNLFTSVEISGANAAGYSTGDAIAAVEEVAAQTLSANYSVDYTGLTREEISAGSQTIIIFLLSLVFVYFILAAQYESYIKPLAVILSLPLGIMGAFLGQWIFGLENNIYFQIALIMLAGLLAKNAILIVEFGVQRRQHGESIPMAAINAAKVRLRPILMTSFAFIFGMLPLVFSSGIGSLGNKSIATGAATGLLMGTILGVIVIPVLFVVVQWLDEKVKPVKFEKWYHDETVYEEEYVTE